MDENWKPLGEYTDALIRDLIEIKTRPILTQVRRYERIMEASPNKRWLIAWAAATARADEIEIEMRRSAQHGKAS